jgi:4-hydroxybenzoate polyprenyltransferase
VLIAAAGYIINDYFDINIDQINKPTANVVDKIVSRRWAMAWHFVLSGVGIILSGWVSWRTGFWYILLGNFMCVLLLFGYSVSLKRKLLSGNIIISLLTAWVILVISIAEINTQTLVIPAVTEAVNKITRIAFLYAGFAFISSLIREAIKDIEDLQGDERYGCRTMPIVWGVNAAKVYIAVWLVVILALLVILQVYVARFEWWWAMVYSIVFIIGPFVLIFLQLYKAKDQKDYHRLSNWTKLVMLTGILSMIFFYFYL